MKIKMGVVHVIAICQDCTWSSDDYLTAQKEAAKHAKSHKHAVSVDVGKSGTYDGRIPASVKERKI